MSEWNKLSGNWSFEERNFSKWGEERLKELLKAEKDAEDAEYKFSCTYDRAEDFEMSVLVIRGKKRAGYEIEGLTLKVELKDKDGAELFSGRLVIDELAVESGCEDFTLTLKKTPSDPKAAAKDLDLAKKLTRERFVKCFKALVEELSAKL